MYTTITQNTGMLEIQRTRNTPQVKIDTAEGNFTIRGTSVMEDPVEFFKPVMDQVGEYIKAPALVTTVELSMVYFNTSSAKVLLDILRSFETIKDRSNVMIVWVYEQGDEDMLEVGEDYSEIVSLPFKMIEMEGE